MKNFLMLASCKKPSLLILGAMFLVGICACTPEGVINKTKYNGEKITNTCDSFKEEIAALASANSNSAKLVVAEENNSDIDYYYLEPGQYELKEGNLNFRLSGDLE
jgi:hypothetical protein